DKGTDRHHSERDRNPKERVQEGISVHGTLAEGARKVRIERREKNFAAEQEKQNPGHHTRRGKDHEVTVADRKELPAQKARHFKVATGVGRHEKHRARGGHRKQRADTPILRDPRAPSGEREQGQTAERKSYRAEERKNVCSRARFVLMARDQEGKRNPRSAGLRQRHSEEGEAAQDHIDSEHPAQHAHEKTPREGVAK